MTCFIVSAILCFILSKGYQPKLSPDGKFYLERPEVRPYCMRRVLPALLRSHSSWKAVSWSCTCITATIVGLWTGTPWATVLVLGLPVLRQAFFFPVLTDPTGLMFLAMAAYTGRWEYAAIGGVFNEKTPLFGAILTNPMALIGLIPSGIMYLTGKKPLDTDPEWLRMPFKTGLARIGRLADTKISIWPWGGAILGAPSMDMKGWATMALGYGQLICAQDSARLFQYAFLPLVKAVPVPLMPIAALMCWINPERDRV